MELNRDRACKLASEALKRIKSSRWYATEPGIILALGAVITRAAAARDTFNLDDAVKYLEQLRPHCPLLFQDRPLPEPNEIDLKKYTDPTTNTMPPNPFAKSTVNLTEQAWLEQHEPALAAYLKDAANGSSYSALAKRRKEKEQREKLRNLEYGEEQHKNNCFRRNNLTEQNEFRRSFGDALADFMQREAQQEVTLPWLGKTNLTLLSKMAKEKPDLRQAVNESVSVARKWAEGIITESRAQQVSAETILSGIT